MDPVGGTDEYTADIESWVGLANAYIDLGTWHCVTPYVGGGIGFASISVIGLTGRQRSEPGRRLSPGTTRETNFAWAALCRPLLQSDAGPDHRSLLSLHRSRRRQERHPSPRYDNHVTAGGVGIDDITSNDVMLSVRWALGSQPAPMPVAFK